MNENKSDFLRSTKSQRSVKSVTLYMIKYRDRGQNQTALRHRSELISSLQFVCLSPPQAAELLHLQIN